ncbi:MAG: IS1380 family transposase, partial [Actinomycetes bacterium]
RTRIVNVPARLARPQRRPILHLPAHWPWAVQWTRLATNLANGPAPPTPA